MPHTQALKNLIQLRRLRFEGVREQRFARFYATQYLKLSRHYLTLGLALLLAFAFVDIWSLSQAVWPALLLRLVLFSVLLGTLHYALRHRRRRTPFYIMWFESIGLILSNLVIMTISLLAAKEGLPEYQNSALLIILFTATLSRLPFRFCLLTLSISLATYTASAWWLASVSGQAISLKEMAIVAVAALMSIIHCFAREYESRRHYLITVELKAQRQQLLRTQQQLHWLVEHDVLTGLYNRRYFDELLAKNCAACASARNPLTLLLIDVDHFKRINDQLGHMAGDECLRQLSQVLASFSRRQHDFVARIGGEEFAIVLPQMGLDTAQERAQVLCQAIIERGLRHADGAPVSVSVGLAVYVGKRRHNQGAAKNGELAAQALRLSADSALYQAKHAGRNQVANGGEISLPADTYAQ
ncbi:MAG: diguanylate cyclase [Aeromonas sp.]